MRAGDLGANGRGGTSLGVDGKHQRAITAGAGSRQSARHAPRWPNAPDPTTFHYQTARRSTLVGARLSRSVDQHDWSGCGRAADSSENNVCRRSKSPSLVAFLHSHRSDVASVAAACT